MVDYGFAYEVQSCLEYFFRLVRWFCMVTVLINSTQMSAQSAQNMSHFKILNSAKSRYLKYFGAKFEFVIFVKSNLSNFELRNSRDLGLIQISLVTFLLLLLSLSQLNKGGDEERAGS